MRCKKGFAWGRVNNTKREKDGAKANDGLETTPREGIRRAACLFGSRGENALAPGKVLHRGVSLLENSVNFGHGRFICYVSRDKDEGAEKNNKATNIWHWGQLPSLLWASG